jgi:hypothetical protein
MHSDGNTEIRKHFLQRSNEIVARHRPATPILNPKTALDGDGFQRRAEPIDAIFQIRVENCTRAHRPFAKRSVWTGVFAKRLEIE